MLVYPVPYEELAGWVFMQHGFKRPPAFDLIQNMENIDYRDENKERVYEAV